MAKLFTNALETLMRLTLPLHAVFPRLITYLFVLLTTTASVAATAQTETIRFAPLPMENRETVVKQNRPMVLYLKKALNVNIEFVFTDNYADIIKSFAQDKIDLAYLGPLPYVELRAKDDKAEPLVHFNEASGKPMYTCALVTLADSPLKLQGLKNSRIGLTQPLSTCGYLSVNGLLQEQGSRLEDNRYTYLDKHDAVALAVVRGEFDAGGLKTAIGKKYGHLGLKIVAETAPMPSFGLVANRATMSASTIQALQNALTKLDPAADQEMLASWGENIRYGAVAASDKDYDVVRKFKGTSEIPVANKNQ
ncbi:PhnD/SsuA/transferrin family substrate-binding protein [uncultured Desulfobulbus sp.]|uniref:PhnD/SsuA/transferrin family substrate-binding protein n=1 Tax=uncultured Desulfobulbus sp. TaxID=239745 RepID=UPI0029C814C6|nr:PhnD/SsuA/transferrin family substrate-binding protein [uncultured Desulfobulbus sp.]